MLNSLRYGAVALIWFILKQWLVYAAIALVAVLMMSVFSSAIRGGHTIMERLLSATVPLLALTMILFGYISFQYYGGAIDENFEKQVMDEGNMLAALFGQESFQEIEYPYDYSTEAYRYLSQQLATRELYTRVLYYESGQIYVGVDKNSPCFYPGEILMNLPAEDLYKRAALTGESVNGVIEDQQGRRLVCITPVGGLSGETVYLLETGVYTANVSAYTANYVKDFAVVCAAFLVIVLVMLMVLFYRILAPIGEIKREMQLFADGDRSIRIRSTSEDELTGITQVFNKMADDINVQIVSLERLSETYYHFVPPSMIGLLGQDNLASLTLGSSVKGNFAVMNVRLYPEESLSIEQKESLMNRFFSTVNRFAKQSEIVSIIDDANLQSIMLICKEGAEAAATAALDDPGPDRCGEPSLRGGWPAGCGLRGGSDRCILRHLWRRGALHSGGAGSGVREDSGAHRIPAEHGKPLPDDRGSRREAGQRRPVRAPLCGPSEDGGTGYRLCGYV